MRTVTRHAEVTLILPKEKENGQFLIIAILAILHDYAMRKNNIDCAASIRCHLEA